MTVRTDKGISRKCNWPLVLVAVALLLLGLYFGNLALFNIWQSAFPKNEPNTGVLEARFWLFATLSFVSIFASISIGAFLVNKVNRERKNKDE